MLKVSAYLFVALAATAALAAAVSFVVNFERIENDDENPFKPLDGAFCPGCCAAAP